MSDSLSELLMQYAQQFEDQHAPQNITIALRESAKELDRLRERLEIDPAHPYDGIYCRDETIRGQDAEITRLKAKVDALTDGLDEVRRFLADPLDPDDVICARDEADRVLRADLTPSQEKTDV
jgi:hypothetical protein